MQKQMENGEQVSIETAPYESKFNSLYSLNVNEKVEKKNGLTYLSWAWAWAEFKKIYPTAQYRIIKNPTNNLPYFVDPEIGIVCYTEVSVDGLVYEMWLPVLDSANKAMKLEPYSYYVKESRTGKMLEKHVEKATMFDINKTIMRCLVKNLSMFGLGLYIYAGEDLPEELSGTDQQDLMTQSSETRKVISRKTAATTQKQQSYNDRYDAIRNALNSINSVDALLDLYNQHKNEVESNPEIKNQFSHRKQLLQPAKIA